MATQATQPQAAPVKKEPEIPVYQVVHGALKYGGVRYTKDDMVPIGDADEAKRLQKLKVIKRVK
jgi:hypothetical protein